MRAPVRVMSSARAVAGSRTVATASMRRQAARTYSNSGRQRSYSGPTIQYSRPCRRWPKSSMAALWLLPARSPPAMRRMRAGQSWAARWAGRGPIADALPEVRHGPRAGRRGTGVQGAVVLGLGLAKPLVARGRRDTETATERSAVGARLARQRYEFGLRVFHRRILERPRFRFLSSRHVFTPSDADVFTFSPNVFTFGLDVFSSGPDAFSRRLHVFTVSPGLVVLEGENRLDVQRSPRIVGWARGREVRNERGQEGGDRLGLVARKTPHLFRPKTPEPASPPGEGEGRAPPEELGTEGGDRLAADHSAQRRSGSRGKGHAARRERGQATAAMSERSRWDRWKAAEGGVIVRSARSRLRSRMAGEWDIAAWISYDTRYEYRRQACAQHSSVQL